MVGSLSGCYNNIMVCHMMLALHLLWTNNSYNCGMFNIFLQQMAGKAIGPSSFHVLSVFFASWHPVRAWCASGCLWSPRLRGRQFLGVLRMLVETTCPYKGLNIDIIWHDHILFQKKQKQWRILSIEHLKKSHIRLSSSFIRCVALQQHVFCWW
jgi:hypothetical protein